MSINSELRPVLRAGLRYGIDPSRGYPRTAAEMARAFGGVWTGGAGYLMNESSGNLAPVFGSPTLTATGTPTYRTPGPRGGDDWAIGLDAAADGWNGGASDFDVIDTDDLMIVGVVRIPSTLTSGQCRMLVKNNGPFYAIDYYAVGGGQAVISFSDSVDSGDANAGVGSCHFNKWHAFGAVMERATNRARMCTIALSDNTTFLSAQTNIAAVGSLTNTATFRIGSIADAVFHSAALYITKGSGIATGVAANLRAYLQNFVATVKP